MRKFFVQKKLFHLTVLATLVAWMVFSIPVYGCDHDSCQSHPSAGVEQGMSLPCHEESSNDETCDSCSCCLELPYAPHNDQVALQSWSTGKIFKELNDQFFVVNLSFIPLRPLGKSFFPPGKDPHSTLPSFDRYLFNQSFLM